MSENINKFGGKWHDIYILIIGFVLTTLGGGIIAYFVQTGSWKYQNEQIQLKNDEKHAENILSDISCLLDNRIYRSRRIIWVYSNQITPMDSEKCWNDYDQAKQNWNVNFDKNANLLKLYFGDKAYRLYKCLMNNDLSVADQLLTKFRIKSTPQLYAQIENQINKNSIDGNELYVYLSHQIMYDKIGKFQ